MIRRKQQVLFFVLGAASVILAILFFRFGQWFMENVGMERITDDIGIEKYPNRLIYVIGKDTELDLEGGIVWIGESREEASLYEMTNPRYWFDISTDADFTREGVYEVTLTHGAECSFPIQVISPDYVD